MTNTSAGRLLAAMTTPRKRTDDPVVQAVRENSSRPPRIRDDSADRLADALTATDEDDR